MPEPHQGLLLLLGGKPKGMADGGEAMGDEDEPMTACAEELIQAVHSKDAKGVVSAMRSAFELMESEPHEEAEEGPEDEQ